ncbi:hypothetical protein KHA93_02910 [Bacillus sp. FJAT-49732]|uniref:Uncharacterized protein n=1 Tax=Lederbergia citrisecunda TaxID=2833583 RepID=A0A942TK52_9BACI|nr:hypothetical protein [Lederbergia citrisecunda]MBS4198598.1 hypothetical protein [Lederbergia citrisecunda]
MPIQELKQIIATQKSVSTSRLEEIARRIDLLYINQGKTIRNQRNTLNQLNSRLQRLEVKADRRKQAMQDYENLKMHHRNLEREFNILRGKYEQKS